MKSISKYISILSLVIIGCKEEPSKPKVIYEKSKTEKKNAVAQNKILVADLPIQIPGTTTLVYPIGEFSVPNERARYNTDNSFVVSNASDYEITGYLSNIKFQQVGSDSLVALTDKPIMIESATYLKTMADKLKKYFIVYIAETSDSNQDDKIDTNDVRDIYISDVQGKNFTKLSSDIQEVIDWKVVESQNRLYFRTVEDINKNGAFDKDDTIHYHYVDLSKPDLKVLDYHPVN
jgi:hypothetical protein